MKQFDSADIFEAYKHVDAGGQALVVSNHSAEVYPNAPKCFCRAKRFAHLIDNDKERLTATAKQFGVRRVVIGRRGRRGQHVDLCLKPLERAIEAAEATRKEGQS